MSISQATITSLLPLVLGGMVSYFKPFLEDQKEFKNRCARIMSITTENIAKALARLLASERLSQGFDNVTRGDGYKTADPYDDVATMIAKQAKLHFRISMRLLVYRACYFVLLVGLIFGLLGLIASRLLPDNDNIIICVCVFTASVQIAAVALLYYLTRRSEDDEEIL